MAYPVLPMSIKTLLSKATSNQFILPALQREFVWKPKDICKLFDSLMLEYPINTMMFWNVTNIPSQPIAFYQFLSPNHTEGTTNMRFSSTACLPSQSFNVVIDGQQRITSLLIGFAGSYKKAASKNAMHLYLRLDTAKTNGDQEYDFQFLTQQKLAANQKKGEVWFRVNDILLPAFNVVGTLNSLGLINNAYAQTTLNTLFNVINNNNVLNYYDINGSNIDDVLEIFVRTNSGGYALNKGDLLMSALTVDWAAKGYALNPRDYVSDIIDDVERIGFKIDKDWVFNAFLMLTGASMSLKVSTFMTGSVASDIYTNNVQIKDAIKKAFELVASFHLLEKGLTTKLAVLPLAYFIYKKSTAAILPTNAMSTVFNDMRKFLFRAILQNLFEAGTVNTLTSLRSIIDKSGKNNYFPFNDIQAAFPKLSVTTSDLYGFMRTRKAAAFPVLNIIYALGYDNNLTTVCPVSSANYEVDHIHPKKNFEPANLSNVSFTTPNDAAVAGDNVTFDTVVNLELLDASINSSKNASSLVSWLSGMLPALRMQLPKDHFFAGLPFDLADFETFVGVNGRQRQLLVALSYL